MKRAIRLLLWLTLWTGIIYPLTITGIGELFFRKQARGSLLVNANQQVIGSYWIGQSFREARYFWPRPSATDYNALPSSGSNLGPTNHLLAELVKERSAYLSSLSEIPSDLLFASGSGLDPHISPEAARAQVARVAAARHLDPARLVALIEEVAESRALGFLGMPRVNVLQLNLKLDELL